MIIASPPAASRRRLLQGLPHRRLVVLLVIDGLAAFACSTVERTEADAQRQLLCRSLWQRVCTRSVSAAVLTTGAEYFASVILSPRRGVARAGPRPSAHQPRASRRPARRGDNRKRRRDAPIKTDKKSRPAPQEMLSLEAFSLLYGALALALLGVSIWSLVVNAQAGGNALQQAAVVWGAAVAIHYGAVWPIFLAARACISSFSPPRSFDCPHRVVCVSLFFGL